MNAADGYSARWHLVNGKPVPKGPALDYVLAVLAEKLGPLASPPEAPVEPVPVPVMPVGFPEVQHSTPNKGGSMKPLGIVFHSSYGSASGSLSWIKNAESKVSYHSLIFPDGTRHNVVPFDRVAWHAGRSSFRGRSGCNSFMIGLSWEGNLYTRQLSEAEIQSAVEIAVRLMRQYGISIDWVTDHRTISPGRKEDIPPQVLEMVKARIAAALQNAA